MATVKAIPARLRMMVEACCWMFVMDNISTLRISVARIKSTEQEIEALRTRSKAAEEQVAVLHDSLGTARVRISDLEIRVEDAKA
ncbi:hypothetical protein Tco_1186061 [Tanacetum coccineum]